MGGGTPAHGLAEFGGEARARPVEVVLDEAREVAVLVREPGVGVGVRVRGVGGWVGEGVAVLVREPARLRA